jgi:hypothetical protein
LEFNLQPRDACAMPEVSRPHLPGRPKNAGAIAPQQFRENPMAETTVPFKEVKRLFGDIDDHHVVEIIESGAAMNELEEVAAHLADETDVMGELERPLTGRALQIFQMLRRDEERVQEDR